MDLYELGDILNKMYSTAPNGEAVAMIHLFGIKFAEEIKELDYSAKAIAKAAKINESYGTEISKGVKLAQYVVAK